MSPPCAKGLAAKPPGGLFFHNPSVNFVDTSPYTGEAEPGTGFLVGRCTASPGASHKAGGGLSEITD